MGCGKTHKRILPDEERKLAERNDILYGSVYGQHGDRCRAGICQYADPCGGCTL